MFSALFGAFVERVVTFLFLKLWKRKESETGKGRRLRGCNNSPEKHPVENDERGAKTPQEHEQRF